MNRNQVVGLFATFGLWTTACAQDASDDPDTEVREFDLFNGFWTDFTSDERVPVSCPSGFAVDAMECRGSECDDVTLHCGAISSSSNAGNFSGFISEELPNNSVVCGLNQFMIGVACREDFCDDMAIQCATFDGRNRGFCNWTSYFSEEQQFKFLDNGFAAAGLQCRGSNCDDIRILECSVL
jgi:hypothetical protein